MQQKTNTFWFMTAASINIFILVMLFYGHPCHCQREKRLFPVFSLVIFRNSACLGTNSTVGTCLSASSCNTFRGNNSSVRCASGYGICCIFLLTCGATLNQNNSYFVNPGYPSSTASEETCLVLVDKVNGNIVQLRLDFEEFIINGVTSRACENDVFQVFGQDTNSVVPPICGMNNGQHIYVGVGAVRGPIMLAMTTSNAGSRRWRIKVTQFEKGSPSLAPNGCLQYYTGPTGNVQSFNFDSDVAPDQSNVIRNLNYAICIRRETGYCAIQYTAPVGFFSLSGPAQVSTDSACLNAQGVLYIPFSRYCGGSGATTPLTATSSVAGRFRMIFITESGTPQGTIRGFRLDYQQMLCN